MFEDDPFTAWFFTIVSVSLSLYLLNKFLIGGGHVEDFGSNSILSEIVVNGRISDKSTGKLLNKRLVIFYLNGEEITRDISNFKEAVFSEDKSEPGDGVFTFTVPNKYKIPIYKLNTNVKSSLIREHPDEEHKQAIVVFNAVYEGEQIVFRIPSKSADYQIKIIPGPVETLPIEFKKSSKTYLLEDNRISFEKPRQYLGNNPIDSIHYAIRRDTVSLRTPIKVPLDNCAGSGKIKQSYSQKRTYVHLVEGTISAKVGGELPLPQFFNINLSAELKGHYGFREGESFEEEYKFELEAEPGHKHIYEITCNEIWEIGSAFVKLTDGKTIEIPFKVKTAIVYEIKPTAKVSCL